MYFRKTKFQYQFHFPLTYTFVMSNTSREQEEEVYTLSQVDELIQYCADGKLDIVRLYINNDTVNCVDNEGRTPLYAAACSGNVELCKYLLSVS